MSSKDRSPRRRRIAVGLGTAAGASLAAAFLSMGTAHAIVGETPDPFDDLGVSNASTLDPFVNSIDPFFAANLDGYADNIVATDANAFADLFGPSGAALDTALPTLSAALDPSYGAIATADADPLADLFPSLATSLAPVDTMLDGIPIGTTNLGAFLDVFVDAFLSASSTAF
jgi:hypothetical protein